MALVHIDHIETMNVHMCISMFVVHICSTDYQCQNIVCEILNYERESWNHECSINIKMSGSDLQPRKVELASAHKKCDDYREYFTHNNEACKNPYKTTLSH